MIKYTNPLVRGFRMKDPLDEIFVKEHPNKLRKISGAERVLGWKNKAVGFWDIRKYKKDYRLLCTVNPLTNDNLPIRTCDVIKEYKGIENFDNQFEIRFSKKKLLELSRKLNKKIKDWNLEAGE